MSEIDRERLERALAGDNMELRALVEQMMPVVRARVTRALGRRLGFHARNLSSEVSDLSQEVFVTLFSAGAKSLRSWEPDRGLSFLNFVGLLAQHRAAEVLRTQRWLRQADEQPLQESQLQSTTRDTTSGSDLMQRLLEYMEGTLTERGLEMFERLYIRLQSIEQVCEETGMTAQAVYQWRARLTKTARDGLRKLEAETPSEAPRARAAGAREERSKR